MSQNRSFLCLEDLPWGNWSLSRVRTAQASTGASGQLLDFFLGQIYWLGNKAGVYLLTWQLLWEDGPVGGGSSRSGPWVRSIQAVSPLGDCQRLLVWPVCCRPSGNGNPVRQSLPSPVSGLVLLGQPLCAGPPRITGLSRDQTGGQACLPHTWWEGFADRCCPL